MISIERKTVLRLIKLYSKAIEDCEELTLFTTYKYLDRRHMNQGICNWLGWQNPDIYYIPKGKIMSLCKRGNIMWAVSPVVCSSKDKIIKSLKTRLRKLKKMLNEQLYR